MSKAPKSADPNYTVNDLPPERGTPEQHAAAAWGRIRAKGLTTVLAHLSPRFLDRVPIRLFGVAYDGWGSNYYLYRDARGCRQVLSPAEHDRAGIAALFEGAEGWLGRLWPASDGGWDDERASDTLMHFGACIGPVSAGALGFELPPASPERMAALLGVTVATLAEDWPGSDAAE